MFRRNKNSGDVKSIVTPVVSFVLLGALVVGAVIFGNLVVERENDCRPLGSSADSDGAMLMVFSEEDEALMLCDVPQETAEYDPPERREVEFPIGDSLYRIPWEEDAEIEGGGFAEIEGNDLHREGYLLIPPSGRDGLVYAKGEFGSIEDCQIFGASSHYESDDFEGFDGSDMFHPDRIQSCRIEIETIITEYEPNGS